VINFNISFFLFSGSEFWDSAKTFKQLHVENYFNDENKEGPVVR